MEVEEQHWIQTYDDFLVSPLNGILGKGVKRRTEYVEQDRNLIEIFRSREERNPLEYLKAISYRMPNPV